jgi:hypothetical protein
VSLSSWPLPQKYEAIKLDNRRTKKIVLYPLPVITLIKKKVWKSLGQSLTLPIGEKNVLFFEEILYTHIKSYRRKKFLM